MKSNPIDGNHLIGFGPYSFIHTFVVLFRLIVIHWKYDDAIEFKQLFSFPLSGRFHLENE